MVRVFSQKDKNTGVSIKNYSSTRKYVSTRECLMDHFWTRAANQFFPSSEKNPLYTPPQTQKSARTIMCASHLPTVHHSMLQRVKNRSINLSFLDTVYLRKPTFQLY